MAEEQGTKKKTLRKITKTRLKNIGLYYLKRFESSVANLRKVLQKRVNDYAYQHPEFNRAEAGEWIEEVLREFESYGYLNDERYSEIKIRGYLAAGKSPRYIKGKLKEKGVDENQLDAYLAEEEYDPKEAALRLAKKRRIGPYRQDEDARRENRTKDMGILVRAGFDYDVVVDVLGLDLEEFEN